MRLPWDRGVAGQERIWMAVYDPAQERRLRLRIEEFEVATRNAGHGWSRIDLTDAFARWMAAQDYREAYFEQPEDLDLALEEFGEFLAGEVRAGLTAPGVDANTVVAVSGVASLFGLTRASDLFKAVSSAIRGRMLVFFPGHYEGSNYRLLDARDGWNYLAVAITATEG